MGVAHFERVRRAMIAEGFNCGQSRAELSPFESETHSNGQLRILSRRPGADPGRQLATG